MHLIFAVWVVRYGTDCPNTDYRENKGSPVPEAPLATTDIHKKNSLFPVPCSLFPVPCSLLPTPYSLLPIPYSIY
ncbi:hypothetical protein [Moorena sp. SIO3H5]|uniref:hypothetical protein n=1 Tax=Moorena sp. SIO3H5 TaxID=2607834 RepID=UPI0025D020ED|nr:hypothetical protein [Moorena sp. SIO3H5]